MFIYVGRLSLSLFHFLTLCVSLSHFVCVAGGEPINFIAHLIDRKNYSFISTKIAKSAQNQLAQHNATHRCGPPRLRKRKKIAKVCDDSAAISIKYA